MTEPAFPNPAAAMQEIATRITAASRIALVTHVDPDGDAIGSLLGLWHAVRKLDKPCWAVDSDPVPWSLGFLPRADAVVTWDAVPTDPAPDLIVSLDCSDMERTGLEREGSRLFPDVSLVEIDHHATNTLFGAICCVDPSAACVGQMVFDLVGLLGVPTDPDMATCLLTALYTDTGSFQYSNADPRALRAAARLMEAGGRHAEIAQTIFRRKRFATARLWGIVLGTLTAQADGRLVTARVTLDAQQACGLVDEGTEGIVEYMAGIDGAELAIVVREASDHSVKVSLRSGLTIDASLLAKQLGGGGHPRAAGCSLPGPLDSAEARVLAAARTTLA